MLFDFLDNRRVVPNARVKAEISIVDPAQIRNPGARLDELLGAVRRTMRADGI